MEIWVVPFYGQGHLLPSIELCKQIASRKFKTVFLIPSILSSYVPADLRRNPVVEIIDITADSGPVFDITHQPPGMNPHISLGLENILKARLLGPNGVRPVCVVLDILMDWTAEIFQNFGVPTVGFFTSGAASAAREYATWKAQPVDIRPGEVQLLPGLPNEMGLTYADNTNQQQHGPPGPPGLPGWSPSPFKGSPLVPWLKNIKTSIGLLINTCDDLERPFIEYLSDQLEMTVWTVGPLLPQGYWKSSGSLVVHDHEIRTINRRSNATEDEVIQWLDGKPRGSVLYVAFGTEVGPTIQEYSQLADALATSTQPFIWAVPHKSGRPGPTQEAFYACGLESKVGPRGLVIHGWAPQLLILSHSSTGGFLSHCGWNSATEAVGRGVPILAWPIRGDQFHTAKLLTSYLRLGFMVSDDLSESITKYDILKGIEKLMGDDHDHTRKRALGIAALFEDGFPLSSVAALDAFTHFINHEQP